MNLPPLASHFLCILAGTLLIKPVSGAGLPDGKAILFPWNTADIHPPPTAKSRYHIVASKKSCLLSTERFRVWSSQRQQSFLLLPKTSEGFELLRQLQGRKDLLLKEGRTLKICDEQGTVSYE